MTVKELSQAFGMSGIELCEKIGYTQQGLSRILRSDKVVYPNKFRNALVKLKTISEEQYIKELSEARNQSDQKRELLEKLAKEYGLYWENETAI